MKGGMLRSEGARFFLAAFFPAERLVRPATGRDRFFADDERAAARCDFRFAFAGARDVLAVTKRLWSPTFTRRDLFHRSA